MRLSKWNLVVKMLGLVKPLTGSMILAVLMGLAGHLCAAFITILAGYALLNVLGEPILSLPVLFGLMALFTLGRAVLRYGEQGMNHFIAFKVLALLRDRVFAALRQLCPAKLEGRSRGDLIALITSDVELLEVFYAHTISPVCIAALFTAIMVGFMGLYHPVLAMLALCAYISVGIVLPGLLSPAGQKDGAAFRQGSGLLSSYLLESLRGLDEILQFGQGTARLSGMDTRTKQLLDIQERMNARTGLNTAITNGVILVFDLLMLLSAGGLYHRGLIGFDGVLISTLALMSSFGPVSALAALATTLPNTFGAARRVLEILEETPITHEIENQAPVSFAGAKGQNITFSYEDQEVLTDFSLDLPQNQVIGITGKSGSGKSTFLRLLMRFWSVKQGQISLSSRNIEAINTADLRAMEGFVTQETHLFQGTIRSNLQIARLDATQEEIEKACQKAAIHDFIISLPQGYETPVAELGSSLSAGQRQRLGLARAFLHDAPLLLLDEPTSNLDTLNEAAILRALNEDRKNRTVVLVSHRASTMKIADLVYCVENGRNS